METFETERVRGRRLNCHDLPFLVRLHLDPEVSRFLGGVRTPEATSAYLDRNIRHWSDHGFGLWSLWTVEGSFIGRAGLRYVDVEGRRELEIAYALVREAWGKGLATEVATTFLKIWEAELDSPSIVGLVMMENTASARVLEKAGLLYEAEVSFHDELCRLFRRRR